MALLTRREVLWLAALLVGLVLLTSGVLLMIEPQYVIELDGRVDESGVREELDDQYSIYERAYDFSELSPRGKKVFVELLDTDRRDGGRVVISGGFLTRPDLPPDFTYPNKQLESVGVSDRYVVRYEGSYYELRTFRRTGSEWHGAVGSALTVTGLLIVLFALRFWYRRRGPPLLSTSTAR